MNKVSSSTRAHQIAGFTLTELLVTITVVCTLGALLFASAKRMRVTALQAKCASNLKQIGLVAFAYAGDNDGRLPLVTEDGYIWFYKLASYQDKPIGSTTILQTIYWCPALPWRGNVNNGTGYGWNLFLGSSYVEQYGDRIRRLSAISKPSSKLLVGTSEKGNGIWPGVAAGGWNRIGAYYSGKANFIFIDGHLEALRPSQVSSANFNTLDP